jgi:hypothetical protein
MRQFVLAVAVCMALIGCDNKPEGAGGAPEGAKPGEAGKAAEGAKVSKHPWGSFKKGSFVKSKMTTQMEVSGSKVNSETTTTETLKDLTADDAIVETERVAANQPATKTDVPHPLRSPDGAKVGDGPKPRTGSEEIEVAGKKMKCDWTETETDINGAKTVTRVYRNEDIPGFTAKMTMKSPTMSVTQEVLEFSAK